MGSAQAASTSARFLVQPLSEVSDLSKEELAAKRLAEKRARQERYKRRLLHLITAKPKSHKQAAWNRQLDAIKKKEENIAKES